MPRRARGEYTNEVLERCPGRVTRFLSGLCAAPEALAILASEAGLTDADLAEGRGLLMACLTPPPVRPAEPAGGDPQHEAVAQLEAWSKPSFARHAASLRRRFPSAAEHLFADLRAGRGAASIVAVGTFLARVDALEKGDPARRATRKEDRAAVELLAARGLTRQERDRLASLVQAALRPTGPLPDLDTPARTAAARRAALVTLKKWEEEWFSAAHAVVKKRALLIRLGLASRKSRTKNEEK